MSSSSSPLNAAASGAPSQSRPGAAQNDLGLGSHVAETSAQRYVNRDGSFNVRRLGLRYFESMTAYHAFIEMSWPKFQLTVAAAYMVTNIVFAIAFFLCGPNAL